MINFTCQLSEALMWQSLNKHYYRCFYEAIFGWDQHLHPPILSSSTIGSLIQVNGKRQSSTKRIFSGRLPLDITVTLNYTVLVLANSKLTILILYKSIPQNKAVYTYKHKHIFMRFVFLEKPNILTLGWRQLVDTILTKGWR